MTSRQVGRVNQQSKGESPLVSGVLQRAAVRAVADKEGEATQEVESGGLRESRFVHDFSQVPINRRSLPKKVSKTPNQTGLPDNLKAGVENLSEYSLDDVRVHYNSPKPNQLQALAYTQGTEIHVASGQEKHLPHEAWHVVQQMQGRVKPTMQMKGVQINDDEGLEREADVMGERVMQKGRLGYLITQKTSQRRHEQKNSTVQLVRGPKEGENIEQYEYDKGIFIEKKESGEKLYQRLQDLLKRKETEDKNTIKEYLARYDPNPEESSKIPSNVENETKEKDKFIGFKTKKKNADKPAYINYANPHEGILIAGSNYANEDLGDGRLSNSEILYHQYQQASQLQNNKLGIKGLKEVIRSSIENKDTQAVLRMCFTKVTDRFNSKSYEAGTEEFFALLGTDNCKGVAFMLIDHSKEMKKSIASIVSKGTGYLKIQLVDQ